MILRRTAAAIPLFFVAAGLCLAGISGLGQVVPAGESSGGWPRPNGGLPIVAGIGVSSFNMDWGTDQFGRQRIMEGATGWLDWNLTHLPGPAPLRGLGIELEARDLSFGTPHSLTNAVVGDKGSNLRQDTAVAGVIYHWRRIGRLRPYAKGLAGLGGLDFQPLEYSPPTYRHDNRTITAFGAGADIRAGHHIWVRADWEYQFWPDLFGSPNPLTPTGFTLGAVYDFSGMHHY